MLIVRSNYVVVILHRDWWVCTDFFFLVCTAVFVCTVAIRSWLSTFESCSPTYCIHRIIGPLDLTVFFFQILRVCGNEIVILWPRDLYWFNCYFRLHECVFTNGVTWLVQLLYRGLLLVVTICFLPACLCSQGRAVTACVWQLLSWRICDGILAAITVWSTPDSLVTPRLWSPPLTLVTGAWPCPLLHPRDVPVRYRRASL